MENTFITETEYQAQSLDNEFLIHKDVMDEYYKEMEEYCKDIERCNRRLLRALKNQFGRRYYEHLKSYLEDCRVTSKIEIVNTPLGDFQTETDYGRKLRSVWIDQSSGYFGDDYHGNIYILVKGFYMMPDVKGVRRKQTAKFLKVPYSC